MNPVNDIPVAHDQSLTVEHNQSISFSMEKWASDVESDTLQYRLQSPSHGTVSGTSHKNITYTPNQDFIGTETLIYRVNEEQSPLTIINGTLTIHVTPVNQAPTAVADQIRVLPEIKSQSIDVLANDSDPDDDPLTIIAIENDRDGHINQGALTITDDKKSVTYTSTSTSTGYDIFYYTISDGREGTAEARLTINITAEENHFPLAVDDNISIADDGEYHFVTAQTLLNNDSDPDGDELEVISFGPTESGTDLLFPLSGTHVLYKTSENHTGSDILYYLLSDKKGGIVQGKAIISITPPNHEPVATDDHITLGQNNPNNIITPLDNDTDPDGDKLMITAAIKGNHGNVIVTHDKRALIYTPETDYVGEDFINYVISDEGGKKSNAVVYLNIIPNTWLTLPDQVITIDEDHDASIPLNKPSEAEGRLNYTIRSQPKHGFLWGIGKTQKYTPNGNFHGTDFFTYQVSNADYTSNIVTVTLSVNSIIDPLIVFPVSLSLVKNTSKEFSLADGVFNTEENRLEYKKSTPSHGTITGTVPNLIYTPDKDYTGGDELPFVLTEYTKEGKVNTFNSFIQFNIRKSNSPPINRNIHRTIKQNQMIRVMMTTTATDADGDVLFYEVTAQPEHGNIINTTGYSITYQPEKNYTGEDRIQFLVSDGITKSNKAYVTINVTDENHAPVANAQQLTVEQNHQLKILLSGTDQDQDTLRYEIRSRPSHGTVKKVGARVIYMPEKDYTGKDLLTFNVSDDTYTSSTAQINIRVTPPTNHAPVANDDHYSIIHNASETSLNVTHNDTDPDGDNLIITAVTQAIQGTVNISADKQALLYRPNTGYQGEDEFTYTISDSDAQTSQASVTLVVLAPPSPVPPTTVNHPPVTQDDIVFMGDATQLVIDVIGNDSDPEGDVITLQSVSSNDDQAKISKGKLLFIPELTKFGVLVVNYVITDNGGNTAKGRVFITREAKSLTIAAPEDLCGAKSINATGTYTQIHPGTARATDNQGNPVAVSLLEPLTKLRPGVHLLHWQAKTGGGSSVSAIQKVCINPQVSVYSPEKVTRGEEFTVRFELNGESPVYPLALPYQVSGTSSSQDHNLVSDIITIDQGTQAHIDVLTLKQRTSQHESSIVVSLAPDVNQGSHGSTHTLITNNHQLMQRPIGALSQNGFPRCTMAKDQGSISLSMTHPSDTFIHWIPSNKDMLNISTDPDTFKFDPQRLADKQTHILAAEAEDQQRHIIPGSRNDYPFKLVTTLPPLGHQDQDKDGIQDINEGHQDTDGDCIPDFQDSIQGCVQLPLALDNQTSFLIEAQGGNCLRLGNHALEQGQGATIQPVVLMKDKGFTPMSGISDFTLFSHHQDNTDTGGDKFTQNVVIPLEKPLPANAILRVFQHNQWQTFINNSDNRLQSAKGNNGVCPAPAVGVNQQDWEPGLVKGHQCLQISLTDNTENDQDNTQNHGIWLTSYVAQISNNNHPPVALDDHVTLHVDQTVEIKVLINDSDPDADLLQLLSVQPQLGTAQITGQSVTYQPPTGFVGTTTLTYTIGDPLGASASGLVHISVTDNQPPVANEDHSQLVQGNSVELNLLLNDKDPEGDPLTLDSIDKPAVLIDKNGLARYTAASDASGMVTLSYTISDNTGNSVTGQWLIKIKARATKTPEPASRVKTETQSGGSTGLSLVILLLVLYRRGKWSQS